MKFIKRSSLCLVIQSKVIGLKVFLEAASQGLLVFLTDLTLPPVRFTRNIKDGFTGQDLPSKLQRKILFNSVEKLFSCVKFNIKICCSWLCNLLDVRVLWDFQQLYLLLLGLGNEGIFNVISSTAADWDRNDLGVGEKGEILCAGPREVVPAWSLRSSKSITGAEKHPSAQNLLRPDKPVSAGL